GARAVRRQRRELLRRSAGAEHSDADRVAAEGSRRPREEGAREKGAGHEEELGMAFQPDIIITTDAGGIMVIEAKVAMHDLPQTEEALKQYMVGMQYRFGLLITPEKGW